MSRQTVLFSRCLTRILACRRTTAHSEAGTARHHISSNKLSRFRCGRYFRASASSGLPAARKNQTSMLPRQHQRSTLKRRSRRAPGVAAVERDEDGRRGPRSAGADRGGMHMECGAFPPLLFLARSRPGIAVNKKSGGKAPHSKAPAGMRRKLATFHHISSKKLSRFRCGRYFRASASRGFPDARKNQSSMLPRKHQRSTLKKRFSASSSVKRSIAV